MFTGHVSDEALELLVASVYTNPRPYTAPASALCGFWRTLALLAHWGWDAQALIVNVGGQLTAANYADIQVSLERS
jgi:U3 small nucleolar RNA-associated protein 22